ncbi:hypothetical protein GS501_02030 [Saccharibacter sp. 17.LH.SD]|nr:hypothetical protein [Saccharibacter sp. 17.LH.SD]
MHLRSSVLSVGVAGVALLSLAGCVQNQPAQQSASAVPNPFGYEKTSSLCEVAPLQTSADGHMSVEMTVGSGEGHCAVAIKKDGGGSYASFGVNPPPEHGKAFLYNYDGHTYISYTPVSAYEGQDQFGVELIPAHDRPRRQLTVKVTVKAVGVSAPKAAAPTAQTATTGKKAVSSGKKTVRRSARVRRHVVAKSRHK